ncbi:hypothetical protein BC936DRAFT_147726 [Jimgerdemannia flammicorona]|uniref:3'-5' exonuclease domain-containing protein n=1 Tax=Jimgerdemannia flammicorona TaxID=994334 RepID=A0A433D4L3_9FUNG|nr:hypothetical protein BC936DRAFT_147726 [Jimgerdemannia flammicorona]
MASEPEWTNTLRACQDAFAALQPFANRDIQFVDTTLHHLRELISYHLKRRESISEPTLAVPTRAVQDPDGRSLLSAPGEITDKERVESEDDDLRVSPFMANGDGKKSEQVGDEPSSPYPVQQAPTNTIKHGTKLAPSSWSRDSSSLIELPLEDGSILTAETITHPSQLRAVTVHLRTITHITLDCEFLGHEKKAIPTLKVLQVGTSPTHGYAFVISKLGPDLVRSVLAPLLTSRDIQRTGFALDNDAPAIEQCLGIRLGRTLDLQAKLRTTDCAHYSLFNAMSARCADWVGYKEFVRIKQGTIDFTKWKARMVWDLDPIPPDALLYAVLDAVSLFHLEAAVEDHESELIDHYWPDYATVDVRRGKRLMTRRMKGSRRNRRGMESSDEDDVDDDDEDLKLKCVEDERNANEEEAEEGSDEGEGKHPGLKWDWGDPLEELPTPPSTPAHKTEISSASLEKQAMEWTDKLPWQSTNVSATTGSIIPPESTNVSATTGSIIPAESMNSSAEWDWLGLPSRTTTTRRVKPYTAASPYTASHSVAASSPILVSASTWDDMMQKSVDIWAEGRDVAAEHTSSQDQADPGAIWNEDWQAMASRGDCDNRPTRNLFAFGAKQNRKTSSKKQGDTAQNIYWNSQQSSEDVWKPIIPWEVPAPQQPSTGGWYAPVSEPRLQDSWKAEMDFPATGEKMWNDPPGNEESPSWAATTYQDYPREKVAPQSYNAQNLESYREGKNKNKPPSVSSPLTRARALPTSNTINIQLADGTTIMADTLSSRADLAVLQPFVNTDVPIIITSQIQNIKKHPIPKLKLLQLVIFESPARLHAFVIIPAHFVHGNTTSNPLRGTVLDTLLTSPLLHRVSWMFDPQALAVHGMLNIMPGKTLDLQAHLHREDFEADQFDDAITKYAGGWEGLERLRRAREQVWGRMGRFNPQVWEQIPLMRDAVIMSVLEGVALAKVAEGARLDIGFDWHRENFGGHAEQKVMEKEDYWPECLPRKNRKLRIAVQSRGDDNTGDTGDNSGDEFYDSEEDYY